MDFLRDDDLDAALGEHFADEPLEYDRSSTTASGRVRGRPGLSPSTGISSMTSARMARHAADRQWDNGQQQPVAIHRDMQFWRQSATGPTHCMPVRLLGQTSIVDNRMCPCGLTRSGGVGGMLMSTRDGDIHRHRPINAPCDIGFGQQHCPDLVSGNHLRHI